MTQPMGNGTHPGVSTIIPCLNGERYLAEAITSVLAQAYQPLEVVVVDDGSTDRSAEIARGLGEMVRVIEQPHGGASVARNRGVANASGELLAFLDADDLWTEGRLHRQVTALVRDPDLDMVLGHTEQFVSPDVPPAARDRFRFDYAPTPARVSGALVVRRAAFDRVGGFSPRWQTGEFIDWYLRAEEKGLRCLFLPETVLRRRLHLANHGLVKREARSDYASLIKAALDRRRLASSGGAS
jgi:glycosyltransferase involved in cell wall biosynthesis